MRTGMLHPKTPTINQKPAWKTRIVCILFFVATLSADRARADEWLMPRTREISSNNGKFVFVVTPHGASQPGHCVGALFRIEGKKRTEIWSRCLINDIAPVEIFVADSGEFVVTMDEWHEVGRLPVVIYDFRGGLARVHTTDTLGLKGDVLHITQTVSSYWWNNGSISFFGLEDKTFIIRLHWGKVVFLELRDGDLMDDDWYNLHKGWLMPEDGMEGDSRLRR